MQAKPRVAARSTAASARSTKRGQQRKPVIDAKKQVDGNSPRPALFAAEESLARPQISQLLCDEVIPVRHWMLGSYFVLRNRGIAAEFGFIAQMVDAVEDAFQMALTQEEIRDEIWEE